MYFPEDSASSFLMRKMRKKMLRVMIEKKRKISPAFV